MTSQKSSQQVSVVTTVVPDTPRKMCGVVMPISSIGECSAEHWSEVKEIVFDAIEKAGFDYNLVSDADDSGIIQKRIVQNLYNNELVVCDVSAKNPNVMFELGIRLAFDKPTIIIKDDKTDYSFDINVIEHLAYPRDLRYSQIVRFKEALANKIKGTFDKSIHDPKNSTFLKSFGEFKVSRLTEREVSSDKYILSVLEDLHSDIGSVKRALLSQKDSLTISNSPSSKARWFNPHSNHFRKLCEMVRFHLNVYLDMTDTTALDILKNDQEEIVVTYIFSVQEVVRFSASQKELREAIHMELINLSS
jgi:hypothetical protein